MDDKARALNSKATKLGILFAGVGLFVAWGWANASRVVSDPESVVRFIVCSGVALLLLFRNAAPVRRRTYDGGPDLKIVIIAMVLCVVGIIVPIHQSVWIGVILLLYVSLRWGLPSSLSANAASVCLVLYWAHPLPSHIEWPLHAIMQRLSVAGSEWLLHLLNIPAWADGTVIHSVEGTFEVPRACSGMRTISTVIICAAGAAMLFHLGFRRGVVLALLGTTQTILFNILRITIMIVGVKTGTTQDAIQGLHDTTGLFLILAILLVQAEAAFWRWTFIYERFCRTKGRIGFPIALGFAGVLLLVSGIFVALSLEKRTKPSRASLIERVARSMSRMDAGTAERAASAAQILDPESPNIRITYAVILRQQNRPQAVLDMVDGMSWQQSMEALSLQLWALHALGERERLVAKFEALPATVIEHPEVALAAAQFAAADDRCADTLRHLKNASTSLRLGDQIRRFFHYLAVHEQWQFIIEIDSSLPYTNADELLIGLTARLIADDQRGATDLLLRHPDLFEKNVNFAGQLLLLAGENPGKEWETLYANCIRANIGTMTPDQLSKHIEPLFRFKQDALAMDAYATLCRRMPGHPGVLLAKARCSPLREEGEDRNHILNNAIAAFRQQERKGDLTADALIGFADALTLAGHAVEASRLLETMREQDPSRIAEALVRQVHIYNRNGDWQKAYEVIQEIRQSERFPEGLTVRELIRIAVGLDLPFMAVTLAERTFIRNPGLPGVRHLFAQVLATSGQTEEAFFVLNESSRRISEMHVRLAEATGRFSAANMMRQQLGLPKPMRHENPSWILPPAEHSVQSLPAQPLSQDVRAKRIESLNLQIKEDSSPFVRGLHAQVLRWYEGEDDGDLKSWIGIGRDALERATALHALGTLQIYEGDADRAAITLEHAIQILPQASVLHQLAILLSAGDQSNVQRAYSACPESSEIWLAQLVSLQRSNAGAEGLSGHLDAACGRPGYSPGTLTRAAEFFLRHNLIELAEKATAQALRQDENYVPAALIGMHTARASGDLSTALKRLNIVSVQAPNPWPYRRVAIQIQMAMENAGMSLVAELERLSDHFPDEQEWPLRLGCIYFAGGDYEHAWRAFGSVIDKHAEELPSTFITRAAESARACGEQAIAVDLLRRRHEKEPANARVLNNLIFTLAQEPTTADEAVALVPELLRHDCRAGDLDTIAVAWDAAGHPHEAQRYIQKALAMTVNSPKIEQIPIYITAAEIQYHLGNKREARVMLEKVIEKAGSVIKNEARIRALLPNLP